MTEKTASRLHPQQDFQHTLREIAVNRADPCELVRELISNSYDAKCRSISIFPLFQYNGLLFFDDGEGLAMTPNERGVIPYVAFFSIGKGTKTKGHGIGYKCQGSKLCFASKRFSVITRCKGEPHWRYFILDNPRETLSEKHDITPQTTTTPAEVLREQILQSPDSRTLLIQKQLDEEFFATQFQTGTLLVIDGFEVEDFSKYFSNNDPEESYIYNYVRFYTAHGDVRRINAEHQGFKPRHVKQVTATIPQETACQLNLWMSNGVGQPRLVNVPAGWPYLEISPEEQKAARKNFDEFAHINYATSIGRFATTFRFQDRQYSVILAIDGKRRALEEYRSLSRQRAARSGISFADQRGVLIASEGIRVCQYDKLFEQPELFNWNVMPEGRDHFVLVINGQFDLVTNRNACAQEAIRVLRQPDFLEKIKRFLEVEIPKEKDGQSLTSLLTRLKRESSNLNLDQYISRNKRLKEGLQGRDQFLIENVPGLEKHWFLAPQTGEEHFVGALYTLLANFVPDSSPMKKYWRRPLTFAAVGVDALCVEDESRYLDSNQILNLEYKFDFTPNVEFNHPLMVVDRVVCWKMKLPDLHASITDAYGYVGTVTKIEGPQGHEFGFVISDIREQHGGSETTSEVLVLELHTLLTATFQLKWRKGTNPPSRKSK